MAYEPIEPTLIPNTTMQKYISTSGRWLTYDITPNEGYCLHLKGLDFEATDPDTLMPTGEILLGYRTASATCASTYDFTQTTIIDGYIAYGEKEFFARPISEVPSNQIFNSGNDHEVMSEGEETETE